MGKRKWFPVTYYALQKKAFLSKCVAKCERILKIGTVSVVVDTHGSAEKVGTRVWLKNVQDPQKVRKILRDAIEADVMERKITYFDKV